MLFRSGTNIKHKTLFRFKIFTYTLEEPSMRIDLSIISLLNRKDKVQSPTFKHIILQAKVPSLNLKHMDDIQRDLLDIRVH